MKTVPLHGKKAAGRVALVDDEDYDLVMQYRWYIFEKPATATRRANGPYAITHVRRGGSRREIRMHCLILGAKGIDHIDHDGLNNRRPNLRVADQTQNGGNQRPRLSARSPYKGVSWRPDVRKWHVEIQAYRQRRHVGFFFSEIEAAYAYDVAARETFGEFACPNFPDGPTQAMRDEWQVQAAECAREPGAASVTWWAQRSPETHVCTVCGGEYQSKATCPTFYCGESCKKKAWYRRTKKRELEGRLF